MLSSVVVLALGLQSVPPQEAKTPPAQVPSVVFDGSGFRLKGLGKEVTEPLASPVSTTKVTYRRDDAFAVWDARGLSVRHRTFTMSTRLPEIAVTPKLFAKEDILVTKELVEKGERTREATALSGSRRLGDEVFFLVRWEEKSGKPWLEALVKVNLKQDKPKPELVGRFGGFTAARGQVDDQLVLVAGSPAAFVRTEDGKWGVSSYNRETNAFAFTPLGQSLRAATTLSPRLAIAMEDTGYGRVRVARIDLTTAARRDVAELVGEPKFVDSGVPPLAIVPTNLGLALRNLDTGVQMLLPEKPVVRRTDAGILVWAEGEPKSAALYSPERFLKLAVAAAPPATKSTTEQSKPTKRIPPRS